MTRRIVYGVGLWVVVAATALTLASIIEPRWLSYRPEGNSIRFSYGLHRKCSTIKGTCEPFPEFADCQLDQRQFCSIWRSVGFLMSFSVIIELATLVAYIVVLAGGKQKRDQGWKVTASLLGFSALVQLIAMALVAYVFDSDARFFDGWELDASWILCTVSWAILGLSGVGLVASAKFLKEEGDYELIPN
ncbi:hypothetical protein EJ05DRAFT_538822 [Pseudovirgaria hyperparasitica]|uniref:Uncharacterized protein n=1 Tax=Pseudovirgaria hyperparasitica TaxID=470096 RepID=A0A6A6W476_9PEZI|nr:uncharacterized protein EJ05DRAFT_538822 [Pseudovirgaria hyperparasitica]KAF2757672.1 hypothetical protein EJ05DRAFT_538822 [Pseudovirgaria hyperparasitica]